MPEPGRESERGREKWYPARKIGQAKVERATVGSKFGSSLV